MLFGLCDEEEPVDKQPAN